MYSSIGSSSERMCPSDKARPTIIEVIDFAIE